MESKKKKYRSRRHCSVPQCKSKCTSEVSLFLFPKIKELANKWADTLNMSERLFKYTYVCSLHFDKSDFTLATSAKKRPRRLKMGAIPSKNLPNSKETQPLEAVARRSKRILKRSSSEKMLKDEAKSSDVLAECRACLQPCPRGERRELFKCWDPPWIGMENTVAEDLVKLTNVQISETDRHSKILCQNCYIILQKANHFVEKVRKADQVLNQRYLNDDSKSTQDNNWPKPIKVDANLCLYDNVEIKDEILSDEENGHVNGDDGQDFSKVDVKVEAEEWHPQQPMLLNVALSLSRLNEELANMNGCTSAEEPNGDTKSLLNEHLRPNNGNGMRYESDEADTNSLDTRIKDEPLSDQETESSVASDLPLECLLCSKTFLSISGLKAHVIAQHSYKTVRRKTSDNMEEHQFKYICKTCQRRFETSTDLMVHETCHNKCVCYGCSASFETFDLLTQHRRSCKGVNPKEVGKVLKLEDVQRLANVAQRILEVMTKYTIFCEDSEQGNFDECYQALLAVITQKEDSLCDELSDTENFCDLSDIDSIDDTLLEYDKHFLADLHCSERSSNAVIENTPLNSFDKTDDGFYSMDGPFKPIANASYPVVKLTRLNSTTIENWSRNIYSNEHSAVYSDDSSSSFGEVTYLDSSILEMSDDTFCSKDIDIELSSDACLSAVFSPNTAAGETNINETDFDEFDDDFHSEDVSACLDILSKYVIEETAENNASDKIEPNVTVDKSSVDAFNNIFKERTSSNDTPVSLPLNSVAEIFKKTNLEKSDKSYSNDIALKTSINVIHCVEKETSINNSCLVGSSVSDVNITKFIEEKSTDSSITVGSSVKEFKDIDNIKEINSCDRNNEDFCANNISVCTANMSNLEAETADDNWNLDNVNEKFDLNKLSICTVNQFNLIQEAPFKGFENVNNNTNSNDFSDNGFKETAANSSSFAKGDNDIYSNSFSHCSVYIPSRINPDIDITNIDNNPVEISSSVRKTGSTNTTVDSQSCRVQYKQKLNVKLKYNYKNKKPRIIAKDYKFIFKPKLTRKLIHGCYSYCKYKCRNNITSQQRINIFEEFWKMDLNTQRKFINNNIHLNKQVYHTQTRKKSRTFFNYVYILPISNQCVRVCKKFFEDTLSIVMVSTFRKLNRPDECLELDSCKNIHKPFKRYNPRVVNSHWNPYLKLINVEIDKKLLSYLPEVLENTNDTNYSKYVKESNLDEMEHYDNTKFGIETNPYDTASFNTEIHSDLSTSDVDVNNTNIDSCTTDTDMSKLDIDNRSFIDTNINACKMKADNIQCEIDNNQIDSETNLLNIDKNHPDTDIAVTQFDTDNNKIKLDITTDQLDIENNQFETKKDQVLDNLSDRNINSIAIDVKKLDISNIDISQLSSDSKETKNYVSKSETDIDHLNTNAESIIYDSSYNSLDIYHPDDNVSKSNNHSYQFDTNQFENKCNKSTTDNTDQLGTHSHKCVEAVEQFFDYTNKPHIGSNKSDTNFYNNQPDSGSKEIELNNYESTTDHKSIDPNQSGTVIKLLFTDIKKPDNVQIPHRPSDQLISNNNKFDTATDQFETNINQSTEAVVKHHNNDSHKQGNIHINRVDTDTNNLYICSPDSDACRINTETEENVIDINESNTSTNLLNTVMNQSVRNIHQEVTDINSPDIRSYHPDMNAHKSDTHVFQSDTNQDPKQLEIYCNQSTKRDNIQLDIDTNQCIVINKPSITDTSKPDICIDNSATKASDCNNPVESNTTNTSKDTSDIFNPDVFKNKLEPKAKEMNSTIQPDEYIDQSVTDINKPNVMYSKDSDVCQKYSDGSNYSKHHMKENSSNIHESGIHLSDFDTDQSNFDSFIIQSKISTQQTNCASINKYVDRTTYTGNRKNNQRKLANHKNKLQRIIGKGYKFMFRYKVTRCLMPGCYKCRYKCTQNITHEQRGNIFKEFWKMNLEAQTIFLNDNVLLINPFVHHTVEGVRSKLNHSFFLPSNNQRVRVCKKFFVNTLSICMIDIDKKICYLSVMKSRMNPFIKLVDIVFDKKLSSYLVPEPSSHYFPLNNNSCRSESDSISFYTIHPDGVTEVDTLQNTLSCFNTQSSNVNTQIASFDTCIANVNSQASIETYPLDIQLLHKQSQLSDVFIQPINVDVCQTGIDKYSDSENQSPKYTQLSNVDSQPIKNTCLARTETFSSYCDFQSSDRLDRGMDIQSSSGEAQSFKAILKDWASTQTLNTTNINIESQPLNMNSSSIDTYLPLVDVCTPFNISTNMKGTDLDIWTSVETGQANINKYISGIDTQLPIIDDQIQRVDSGETTIKYYPSSCHTQSYKIGEQASNIDKCPSTIDKYQSYFDTHSCEIDDQVLSVDNSHETTEILYPSSLNNQKCEVGLLCINGDQSAVDTSTSNIDKQPSKLDNQIQSEAVFNTNSPNIDNQTSNDDICKFGITCPSGIEPPDVFNVERSSESNSTDIHQVNNVFNIQPCKLDEQVQNVDKCLTLTETQQEIDTQIKNLIPYLDNHGILETNFDYQQTNTGCQISRDTLKGSTKTSDITNDDASQTNIYNNESGDIHQMGLNLLDKSSDIYKPDNTNSNQNSQPNTNLNQTSILDKFEVDCNTNQVDNASLSDTTLLHSCESKQLLGTHSNTCDIEPHKIDNLNTIPATIVYSLTCLDNQSSNVNYVNNQAICLTEPFDSVLSQLQSNLHVEQIDNDIPAVSADTCQGINNSSSSIYTHLSSADSGDSSVNSNCHITEGYPNSVSNFDTELFSEETDISGVENFPPYFDIKSSSEFIQPDTVDRSNFESAPTYHDQSLNQYALLSNVNSQPTSVECWQTTTETYPFYYDNQSKEYAELSHIESQSNEIDSCQTRLDEIDSCQASFDAQPHAVNITAPDDAQSFKSILSVWAS